MLFPSGGFSNRIAIGLQYILSCSFCLGAAARKAFIIRIQQVPHKRISHSSGRLWNLRHFNFLLVVGVSSLQRTPAS